MRAAVVHLACLLPILATAPPVQAGDDAVEQGEGWRMALPGATPRQSSTGAVRLAWGKAVERTTVLDDGRGLVRTFSTYAFEKPSRGRLSPGGLQTLPRAFTRDRACTARVVSRKPLSVAGAMRPAIVFGGSCEGGDRYRRAVVIVAGRLFAFHVAWTAPAASPDLDRQLSDLMSGFALTATAPPPGR